MLTATGRGAAWRSAQASASAASTTPALAHTKGQRGSAPFSHSASHGATAAARPSPSIASATRPGCAGLAACLPIRLSGGARKADEVAVHSSVTATKTAGDPCGASQGSARNAAADSTVAPASQGARRRCSASTRSEATPQA
ncbi:MAG: hypothetical protein IPI08_06030 [Betaproteobacteria bacterium]|nr:hypothetical protein [Betaproteobacteria bacterium]